MKADLQSSEQKSAYCRLMLSGENVRSHIRQTFHLPSAGAGALPPPELSVHCSCCAPEGVRAKWLHCVDEPVKPLLAPASATGRSAVASMALRERFLERSLRSDSLDATQRVFSWTSAFKSRPMARLGLTGWARIAMWRWGAYAMGVCRARVEGRSVWAGGRFGSTRDSSLWASDVFDAPLAPSWTTNIHPKAPRCDYLHHRVAALFNVNSQCALAPHSPPADVRLTSRHGGRTCYARSSLFDNGRGRSSTGKRGLKLDKEAFVRRLQDTAQESTKPRDSTTEREDEGHGKQ
ncbi:hypothetical protein PHYPSEUDO_006572 [Phytophthora pseudosyringae]|uniref:Uncharacterized protein n=1 Tax=Phytophthora pseudosyringae TaxID=221518 RepID=A0A8T1VIA6_9STRA|nr:hypothetical protein PHYPSEUDO_006572 [Phytophthora pseudosyringae]